MEHDPYAQEKRMQNQSNDGARGGGRDRDRRPARAN